MTPRITNALPVICAAVLSASMASSAWSAENGSQTENKLFQLNAQLLDYKKMSRNELDSGPRAGADAVAPKMALAVPLKAGVPVAQKQVPPPAEPDNGFMHEYNVDWSGWMGKVADRWYYVLQTAEETFNCEFVTARPALVQFTIWSNGQISDVSLKQSSGNAIYDQLQMVALINAGPMPRFPAGTKRNAITLVQGWESHVKQANETGYVPGSFGKGFPMEKVREWVKPR
ncbi:MAG TPA: TonB C-terminal domain-containing protein [Chroococcales cyanobacterium]